MSLMEGFSFSFFLGGGELFLGFDQNYKNERSIMEIKETFKNEAVINS